MQNQPLVLILNKSFVPINVTDYKRAIVLIFSKRAKILEHKTYNLYDWDEWGRLKLSGYREIKTSSRTYAVPEILILNNFDKFQKRKFKANKKNIYKRDQGKCQYCETFLNYSQATIDHINPRSKNGKLSWDNCVISCIRCNHKKANLSLEQANMKLIRNPGIPNFNITDINSFFYFEAKVPESWKIFQEQKN